MRNLKVAIKVLSLFYIGILIGNVYSWWNCQWKYRMPITITETSGSDLIDYPINITVDTATLISQGKLNSDCSDIRFTYLNTTTNQEIEIPYWIESGCNTANTVIWINVPEIPANGVVTTYMYYGNPGATSTSSVTSVFPGYVQNTTAVYSATYQTPFCSSPTNSCDTANLVVCRDNIAGGTEPNQPNTLNSACTDGTSGTCYSDESTERIIVYINNNRPIIGGDTINVVAKFYCWGTADNVAIWVSTDLGTTWTNIHQSACPGAGFYTVTATYTLPANATDFNVVVRGQIVYNTATNAECITGNWNDHDDVVVSVYRGGVPTTVTLGTEEYNGVTGITISPPSGTIVNSDIVTINATLTRQNYDCPVTCTLQVTSPSSNSYTMQVSGGYDYCWVDLDLNTIAGLSTTNGLVNYSIIAQVVDSFTNSSSLIVPIDHTVNITSPANNTIINGQITIQASSDSILDITSCIVETNIGNFTGTLTSDSTCEITLDLTDTCPDSIWYRVWMKNTADVSNVSDWYFADNDFIYNLRVTSPANASTVNTDVVTISAAFNVACNQDLTEEIIFTYPSNLTDNMTCSGTTCTYTKDLNYFVQPDGKVQYKVRISHPNEIEETGLYEFYVPTSHTVTIIEPELGDPVLGSGFHVKVQSDSVLKIDSCYPQLPSGATYYNLVVDPETKTCEFDVNLENYCSSNTIDISVTLQNTAGVNATSPIQSHLIYDPPIEVQFTDKVPINSTDVRYLPLEVQVNKVLLGGVYVPATKKFIYEVQGTNTTVYGEDSGVAILELYHPNITNIIGSKGTGTISVKVYGIGRCSNVNATELRNISIPETIFNVSFVSPPTPPDGSTLSIKFMEIKGNVTENILANTQCTLEVSKDDGFTWIQAKTMDNCYTYLVNEELDTPLGYLLYRINITDTRWGETNLSVVRRVNIPANATPIPTVNSGMSPDTVQQTINNAIANGDPAVLFESGVYYLNLVIDPQGQNIRLLGAGSTIKPYSKGFPVFTIKSGNATLENFIISDALFNIKVTGGYAKIKDTTINGGLYGVQVQNAQVDIENSVLNAKLAGVYMENTVGSKIIDSVLKGKVWGAYFRNADGVIIDPSYLEGKVFGVYFAGTSNNNIIVNSTIKAKVFGILIDSGSNNTIQNSNIYAQVFGIKIPGNNTIENVVIDGIKVFGIYSTQPNTIRNVLIKQAKVFGLYITGDAYNVTIYNSKLGSNLIGNGTIDYFTLGDTTVNLSYSGSIMAMQDDPKKHPDGVIYTGQAVKILGSGQVNITFAYDNPAYSQYYVYKMLGSLAELVASGKYVEANNIGTYALYAK